MPEQAIVAPPVETSAVAITDAPVETTATETETTDEVVEETPAEETSAPEQTESESTEDSPEAAKDKEEDLAEWTGNAGRRMRDLYKAAPGLQAVLDKYPSIKNEITASFRRDAALRDHNMTVAEIKEYRERLPNGLQDLATIEQEVQELGQIDEAFYGKQPGTLIKHMHEADPEAAISFLREAPLQLSKLDPDAYSEVFSAIVDSTFRRDRVADIAMRAYNRAKAKGDNDQMADAAELYNYLQSFGKQNVEETPRERAIREREENLKRTEQDGHTKSYETFKKTHLSDAAKFYSETIRNNPLFKKLPQAVTEAKKSRMVDLIASQVRQHLTKSPAFMAQWRVANNSQNLEKALQAIKGPQGWQPWLVSMYTRRVLAEELPGIIEGNNAANGKKRAAAARTEISNRQQPRTPSPASKTAQREYTMDEVMAPDFEAKHPGVLDALIEKQRNRR